MSFPVSHRKARPQAGLTLVEVLLAVALLAVVATMVFGSLLMTTRAIDAGRELADREQAIRRVLRLMAEELSMVAPSTASFPWVGMNGVQDGQPADTIAFLTLSDGLGITAGRDSELMRVVYTRDGGRLVRFVRRNLYGLTDESLDQVDLTNRVVAFNIRYFDGKSLIWVDEWTATTGNLPRALLLEVTFQQPDAEPLTVREWVPVGTS